MDLPQLDPEIESLRLSLHDARQQIQALQDLLSDLVKRNNELTKELHGHLSEGTTLRT